MLCFKVYGKVGQGKNMLSLTWPETWAKGGKKNTTVTLTWTQDQGQGIELLPILELAPRLGRNILLTPENKIQPISEHE